MRRRGWLDEELKRAERHMAIWRQWEEGEVTTTRGTPGKDRAAKGPKAKAQAAENRNARDREFGPN